MWKNSYSYRGGRSNAVTRAFGRVFGGPMKRVGEFLTWCHDRTIGSLKTAQRERKNRLLVEKRDHFKITLLKRASQSTKKNWSRFKKTVGPILVPPWLQAYGKKVGKNLKQTGKTISRGYYDLEERMSKSVWARWLLFPLKFTIKSAGTTYEFSRRWLKTREFRHLLGGIPALLLAVPLAACVVRIPFHTPARKAEHYRRAAMEAWKINDVEAANLYHRKIQALGGGNDLAIYESALLAAGSNRLKEAERLMKQISPLADDEPGFPAGHVWLAKHALQDQGRSTEERADFAKRHLQKALRMDDRNLEARLVLAEISLRTRDFARARNWIAPIRGDHTAVALMTARIDIAEGKVAAGSQSMRSVSERFRRREANNEDLSFDDYASWARAEELLGNHREVRRIMKEFMNEIDATENPLQHNELIRFYLRQFDQFASQGFLYRDTQMQLLDRAINLDSQNEDTLIRVAMLSEVTDDAGRWAEELIERTEQREGLPVEVQKLLGVMAYKRDDMPQARFWIEKAFEQEPKSAGLANNLAWIYSNVEPNDLDRALELANRAIELAPQNSGYRDTRGQILVKIGQWNEAVKDLELALNGAPDSAEIHASLAVAYRALGRDDLANAHQMQADTH